MQDTHDIISRIQQKDRKTLAQSITLLESTAFAKKELAGKLIEALPSNPNTLKIGITGPPGVGKSSFIEALGLHLLSLDHSVCALTVDPSSTLSHGSILGDKTRMEELSRHPDAFIRSSPSGNKLGGLSARSYDVIRLCEAANFDILFIETVGVGQSELDVSEVADITLLLMQAAAGDDLQGIKKGIMEAADIIVVNKDDGKLKDAVRITKKQYQLASHLMKPKYKLWERKVLSCSSLDKVGLEEVWKAILLWKDLMDPHLSALRQQKEAFWFKTKTEQMILDAFWAKASIQKRFQELSQSIIDKDMNISEALAHINKAIDE